MNIIKCGSTAISSSQCNYSVFELEFTALPWASKKVSHYLIGNSYPVEYRTDHAALKGLENVQLDSVKNPCVLRLLEDLLCSEFTVKYVTASENSVADYLNHLLNLECTAPDNPRLLCRFKADQGVVRILQDPGILDYEL